MRACVLLALLTALPGLAQEPVRPLVALNPILQQFEDGPPLAGDFKFLPGETVFCSFQVQGFQPSPDRQVRLTYSIETLDSDQIRLVEPSSDKLETTVTEQDKEWLPRIRYSVPLPPYALPGQYRIAARVKDDLSGREALAEIKVIVGGRAVERSDSPTLRNFRFLRGEEDAEPLRAAAYKSGDTLFARFDVTGYKIGDKNRILVICGISIVAPSGKEVFSEPRAAVAEEETFYPKRYFLGAFSLNVQPKTTPGVYTLVISVRDEVGGQTYQSRQPFRIE
jgi:hypothetical protein